jgi:hypothetical protein
MDEKQDLLEGLEAAFKRDLHLARTNTYISIITVWIALAASAVSGPLLIANLIDAKIGGIFASLPVILVLIESTFSFHARSNFRWDQVVWLRALQRELKYEGKTVAEVSAGWRRMDEVMAERWKSEVNVGIVSYWRSISKKKEGGERA